MDELVLNAQRRERTGKGSARRLRQEGNLPVVMYGEGESLSLIVNTRDLRGLLNTDAGTNALLRLKVKGEEDVNRVVMVRELQRDPLRGDFLHADLVRIAMDREVEVEVPIELEGTPVGVAQNDGYLGQLLSALEVRCLPDAIPASIKVDVSEMGVGDVVHVKDLKLPEGVEVVTDLEEAVASVTVVTVEEAAPAELLEGEGAAEAAEGEGAPAGEAAGKAKDESSEG